ncbi:MAG: hypothetical protein JEZ14_07520 [Marinilabiliaceae bacterium]|nr:hypothetical protein [Marinilabiliaceae bacterium]
MRAFILKREIEKIHAAKCAATTKDQVAVKSFNKATKLKTKLNDDNIIEVEQLVRMWRNQIPII